MRTCDTEVARATGMLDTGSDGVLRLVLEATDTGLWTWDVSSDLVRWSPETYRIHGLQPGDFAGSGAAFFALVHPDDRSRVNDAVLSAVRDRRVYTEHFRILRPDGSIRWVTNRGSASYDAHGAPEAVVGTITDVTERHVTQDAARRMDDGQFLAFLSEQRFRNLADAAPALLWATDDRHHCTFLSRGWHEFTGQGEREGLGMGWIEPVHPEDRERTATVFLDAASRHEAFSLDYRLRRHDGEYRWAIDTGRPRFGLRGEFLGYVGSVIDVHERKVAEEDARRHAAIIDGISKGTQDLIAAQDGEFRYVYFNDAYRRTFESMWGKELNVGTSMLEALADWPEELEKARTLWGRAHAGETFSVTMEFGPAAADRRTFDLRFNPVLDDSGRRIGASHILRDVTEQVRIQQALADSEATLRAAADALQDADRRKDLFLATLSHELRNPLAPIRTAAQVLLDPRLDRERLAAAQTVIQRQVAHMACLLEDLMDVSRITNGKLKLKRERMRLSTATDAAIEATQPLLERKQHRLVVSLPAEPIDLQADPVRIAQILSNLLTNAAKYTDRGGRIELVAARDGTDVVVEVRDDGIGIAPEVLPRLFEMFAQADDSHARTEGGLGIGLALVKGLVELHGGSIVAASDGPGHGTTFTVRLPCAVDARLPGASAGAPGPAPAYRRRILIADDNRDGTDTLAMVLELAGHEVRVAYEGRSALALAAEFRPEVAVLDIGMPGLDGYAVARALRTAGASVPVLIALTGWGQQEDRRLALDAGFDHHLTKPVDVARLESLLAAVTAVSGREPEQRAH